MIKLTPPCKDWTALKIGIYICDTTRKATVGILWETEVFEYVHGTLSINTLITDPNNILKICRKQCMGVLTADNALARWESYLQRRKLSSARQLILLGA